jgi:hypothetical protein
VLASIPWTVLHTCMVVATLRYTSVPQPPGREREEIRKGVLGFVRNAVSWAILAFLADRLGGVARTILGVLFLLLVVVAVAASILYGAGLATGMYKEERREGR